MKHKINIADAVTASRVLFAICLMFCSAFSALFYVFYLLGALSDMVDGRIARKLKLTSSFGAKLDTIADCAFMTAVLVKVIPAFYVPIWLWIWLGVIAIIKLVNLVMGLVLLHGLVSMHTVMNKVTGFMLFLLPFCIGIALWQVTAIAVIVTCSTATFAAIQAGHYIRIGRETE